MFSAERKVDEIPYLPSESRNVHGVGCKAHSEHHGRLNPQEPGNQLLQLLMDVQGPWKQHYLSLTSLQSSVLQLTELSANV